MKTAKTAKTFNGIPVPKGSKIKNKDGKLVVPTKPIIPFIEGDGIGPEIWSATRNIVDEAVRRAYGRKRKISWMEIFAGDKAKALFGEPITDDTIAAIREFVVAIKGPLGTPTGEGMRSLNVHLRQTLNLFQCVRPVRYFDGVPSPMVSPASLDIVIMRENTEDVYAGIEFEVDTANNARVRALLLELGVEVPEDAGIGIKIISRKASKNLVRAAIQYAIDHGRKVVTLMHKGNIQKFTEGAFRKWGYEVARDEFADTVVSEADLWDKHGGKLPEGKILLNDRIADAMFFELLVRPKNFSVIATMNLNGDYISDAAAGQVGGLGIAPGANIGDLAAIFEATHGTAPTIAGKGLANPTSLLLSAAMLLEHLGWTEAVDLIIKGLDTTIKAKTVTSDLAPNMPGSTQLSTSEFGAAVVKNMPKPARKAPQAAAA